MDAPAPVLLLDERLLDELARIYMLAALDELMRQLAAEPSNDTSGK